jgi:hypothetical protein
MSGLLRKLSGFRPEMTRAVLDSVRKDHPITDDGTALPGTGLLEVLREKLRTATDLTIHDVASRLSPREVRACLQLMAMPEGELIHDRALLAVQSRHRSDLVRPAWSLLTNHYPVDRLERFLREIGPNYQWAGLAREPQDAERLDLWFSRESLPSGMVAHFIRTSWSDVDQWMIHEGIDIRSRLATHVWVRILTKCKKKLIEKVGHTTLLEKARTQIVAVQSVFQKRYLNELEGRRGWQEGILEWIRFQHDVPRRGSAQTPFWTDVPLRIREEFRRWAIEEQLRRYFDQIEDPHGRFVFWKQYLDHIDDVRIRMSGHVGLIDFGHFGVAEFSNVGNAAYVYPASHFARMWNVRGNVEGDFKRMDMTVRRPSPGPNGGRMLHTHDWQSRYRSWIWEVINRGIAG